MPKYTNSTNVAAVLSAPAFSGTTTPTQAQVNAIIDEVAEFVDSYTGEIWTTATASEFFDANSDRRMSWITGGGQSAGQWGGSIYQTGGGGRPGLIQRRYMLSHWPIVSVEFVRENVGGVGSVSWVTRSSSYGGDYLIYPLEGAVEFIRSFPMEGRRNVWIGYTYGRDSLPKDVQWAVEQLAASQVIDMIRRASDQQGIKTVTLGGVSYNFSDAEDQKNRLEARAHEILNRRKLHAYGISR